MEATAVNWTVDDVREPRCVVNPKVEEQGVIPLVDHPDWAPLREKMIVALQPFMDARRALERALTPGMQERAEYRDEFEYRQQINAR